MTSKEMAKAYELGATMVEIARAAGTFYSKVRYNLVKEHVDLRPRGRSSGEKKAAGNIVCPYCGEHFAAVAK